MLNTSIVIFKPDGSIWRTYTNPSTFNWDDNGRLYVTPQPTEGAGSITTTLPFYIEQTNR